MLPRRWASVSGRRIAGSRGGGAGNRRLQDRSSAPRWVPRRTRLVSKPWWSGCAGCLDLDAHRNRARHGRLDRRRGACPSGLEPALAPGATRAPDGRPSLVLVGHGTAVTPSTNSACRRRQIQTQPSALQGRPVLCACVGSCCSAATSDEGGRPSTAISRCVASSSAPGGIRPALRATSRIHRARPTERCRVDLGADVGNRTQGRSVR
jgi:hypothetical protein